MDKKKRIIGIAALSAAFATTLVLTITLPITCYGNQSVAATKFFKGLATKTEYLVGSSISLSVSNVTNPENYDYLWYIKDSGSNKPQYLDKTGSSITLDNPSNNWNNAMIYCVLVLKPANNPATFLQNKVPTANPDNSLGNSINADDVALWTSTQLVLSKPFSVSNCQIAVQNSSADDKVFVDTKDNVIVAPINKAITLTATATFDKAYAPYIQYTWYKGGDKVQSSNSPTYTIPAASAPETAQYKCVAQLVSGSSHSNSEASNTYTLNVVKSTNFAAGQTAVSVTGNTGAALTDIPAGNQVTLKANFTLDNKPLETNSQDYSVTYSWTHNGTTVTGDTANSDTLVITKAQTTDSGAYVCTANIAFANGGKIAIASQPSTLSIVQPGVITISTDLEQNLSIANGDKTTLSIVAKLPSNNSGLEENLNYLWQYKTKGSTDWTPVKNNDKPYSEPNLPLTAQQVFALNGAEFQCVVSCSNPLAQISPVTTQTLTLNVVNPTISVNAAITSPTSELKYGDNVTLTATPTWENQSAVTSADNFKYNYSYQWFKKSSAEPEWTPVDQSGNGPTLTISNLTAAEQGAQYECKVTPTNVVTPTAETSKTVAAAPQDTNQSFMENSFTATSKPVTLDIAEFGFEVTAEATPVGEESATASATLTNNLGDKFTVSLGQMQYKNGYQNLPSGYQYVYKWVQSTSNAAGAKWTPITSGTASSENPGEIQSTEAGTFYYRCEITIAKQVTSSDGEAAKTKLVELTNSPVYPSSIITVHTYPTATVNATNQSVNIVHNGNTTLSPTITLNTNTNAALNDPKTVKLDGSTADVNQQLQECKASYSWTYTPKAPSSSQAVILTPENIKTTYKFIQPETCQTATLGINTLNDEASCDGKYSLTVTINGKQYTQQTPFTVTESPATFTVNPTAVAKLGSNQITLTADVQNVSGSQGTGGGSAASGVQDSEKTETVNKARNSAVVTGDPQVDSSYTYTWYILDPNNGNKPVELTNLQPSGSSNNIETLTLNKQLISSQWANKLSFYCKAENNSTHEIEWNSSPAKLQVEIPTINSFNITSTPENGQLNYNTTLTLNTSGTTVSETIDGRSIIYQWQYYNTKTQQWLPINENDSNVTISNGGKTLKISGVDGNYNNLKIRCQASYGEGVVPVNSTNEITVSLQSQELKSVNSGTLTKFAEQIQQGFTPDNLAKTLKGIYGMTNNGGQPFEISLDTKVSWLNTILGLSNESSTQLSTAFGDNPISISAYPVKEQTTLPEKLVAATVEDSNNPGSQTAEGESNQSADQESPAPTYRTMLKFVFTAEPGYTWPTNLNTATQTSKQGLNYQAAVDGQNLTVLVSTNLVPDFVLSTSGNTSIDLSSTDTLTAKVISNNSINSYDWYVVTSSGKMVEISQTGKQDPKFQEIFGADATVQIEPGSSESSSTLTIKNITGSDSLNGLKIYATGTLSRSGSYWQQYPCLTPFTVTYSPSSSSSSVSGPVTEHQ